MSQRFGTILLPEALDRVALKPALLGPYFCPNSMLLA